MDYEYDGHTYQIKKLGLADAKEVLSKLQGIGFFEDPLGSLMNSVSELDGIERKLFGAHVLFLNDQGDWIPMSKPITGSHFEGRVDSYFHILMKAIKHNFDSFLDGGWTIGLEPEAAAE